MKMHKFGTRALVVMLATAALLVGGTMALAKDAGQWWPVKVNAYYGKYDVKMKKPGRPCGSLEGPKVQDWVPP